MLRLKAATNKDLKLLDTMSSLKFGAKIRGEGQNMKIRLEKEGNCLLEQVSGVGNRRLAQYVIFPR
jgi:hypothetical protein